jgi:hypothetical protein
VEERDLIHIRGRQTLFRIKLETDKEINMDINKIIAKKEPEVIGGKPQVYRYWDEEDKKV